MRLGILRVALQPCPLPACRGRATCENCADSAVIRCTQCGLMLQRDHAERADSGVEAAVCKWNNRPNALPSALREADDPIMLRKRIADLEHELSLADTARGRRK